MHIIPADLMFNPVSMAGRSMVEILTSPFAWICYILLAFGIGVFFGKWLESWG